MKFSSVGVLKSVFFLQTVFSALNLQREQTRATSVIRFSNAWLLWVGSFQSNQNKQRH